MFYYNSTEKLLNVAAAVLNNVDDIVVTNRSNYFMCLFAIKLNLFALFVEDM